MNDSERSERAAAVRAKIVGKVSVEKLDRSAGEFADAYKVINDFCFGEVWTRSGLDLKTRSLCTVAILAALRAGRVGVHIKGALNNGATREEVRETLLQVGLYAGFPAATECFETAQKIFDEHFGEQKTEKSTQD